ncbi:MAG: hypothetical protein HYY24_06295 [Verrucomicrobia bacterium]|nr:hypothetical protein [Verrucomicrobiota bacterium]
MNPRSPVFYLITMGRSSIDLYANDVGVPFVDIESCAARVRAKYQATLTPCLF